MSRLDDIEKRINDRMAEIAARVDARDVAEVLKATDFGTTLKLDGDRPEGREIF